jgi:hypothetical protein
MPLFFIHASVSLAFLALLAFIGEIVVHER